MGRGRSKWWTWCPQMFMFVNMFKNEVKRRKKDAVRANKDKALGTYCDNSQWVLPQIYNTSCHPPLMVPAWHAGIKQRTLTSAENVIIFLHSVNFSAIVLLRLIFHVIYFACERNVNGAVKARENFKTKFRQQLISLMVSAHHRCCGVLPNEVSNGH